MEPVVRVTADDHEKVVNYTLQIERCCKRLSQLETLLLKSQTVPGGKTKFDEIDL